MTITLDESTVKALEHRARQMGVEVESMTNDLLKTVIADEDAALAEFGDFMSPREVAAEVYKELGIG